jgi:hypothetical protein
MIAVAMATPPFYLTPQLTSRTHPIFHLDSPPIIIGHSFGGGFTQILLDRGGGAVGVGVAPATVKGVRDLPHSTIKWSAPLLAHAFKN